MRVSKKVLLSILILLSQSSFFVLGVKGGKVGGLSSATHKEELTLSEVLQIEQQEIPDVRSSSPGQEMKIVNLEELEGESLTADFTEGLKKAIEDRIFGNINLGERNCLLKIATLGFLSDLYNNKNVSEYKTLSADIIVTILKRAKEFDTGFLEKMMTNSKIKETLLRAGVSRVHFSRREVLMVR